MKYIIGNWKANMNLNEAKEWSKTFLQLLSNDKAVQQKINANQVIVIVCPPFPLIYPLKEILHKHKIHIGAQSVSHFEKGAYSGETTAKTLNGLVSYAIIGHSERRAHFQETDDLVWQKIEFCIQNKIEPILCIRGTQDEVVPEVKFIAYEPVEAIGTGNNLPVQDVVTMKQNLLIHNDVKFLYGGSVTEEKCKEYLANQAIDGFIIGSTSLDPQRFFSIIQQAP